MAGKCYVVTYTAGLLVTVAVLAASWQYRDGGKTALLGMYSLARSGTYSLIKASPVGSSAGPAPP